MADLDSEITKARVCISPLFLDPFSILYFNHKHVFCLCLKFCRSKQHLHAMLSFSPHSDFLTYVPQYPVKRGYSKQFSSAIHDRAVLPPPSLRCLRRWLLAHGYDNETVINWVTSVWFWLYVPSGHCIYTYAYTHIYKEIIVKQL